MSTGRLALTACVPARAATRPGSYRPSAARGGRRSVARVPALQICAVAAASERRQATGAATTPTVTVKFECLLKVGRRATCL